MHGATTERSITQRIRGGKGNHFRRTGQPPAGGSRSVLQFRPSATSFTGSTITVAITATTVGVSDSVSITGTMAEAPAAALTAPGAPGAALPADDWAERRLRKALYRAGKLGLDRGGPNPSLVTRQTGPC